MFSKLIVMKKTILMGAFLVCALFTQAQGNEQDSKIASILKARTEGDVSFAKLETVKDLSDLASSPNLIPEAKKLTAGREYIANTNFRFKAPAFKIDENSSIQGTVESVDFGELGRTIMFTQDVVSDEALHITFSISGKNVYIVPQKEQGLSLFAIMKGTRLIAALVEYEGNWILKLEDNQVPGIVKEFYRGMTRSEVEEACKVLGGSQIKETGKDSKYTQYSLFWADMKKKYNIYGDYNYQMTNDKKYGDFYFDAQGRLLKWFLYI